MNAKNSIAESIASMRLTTLRLALVSSFLLCASASAAGLGKLTVLSALGQPLRAEIELTAISKDDNGNMVPKLASADAFRQANIALSSALNGLNFSLETRGVRQFVILTSNQAVNEPFLEMLVELNSPSGKLLREYTLLLDPVEMQANNAPLSSSNGKTISKTLNTSVPPAAPLPAQSGTQATAANSSARTVANPEPNPAATLVPPAMVPANKTPRYKTRTGDTLSKIAEQYKPPGVSLEQMLVALQRENSAAFIDHNMNLLRSGRILTIPDSAQIDQASVPQAQKIVLAQALDFSAYRNRLANQVREAPAEKSSDPKKGDSGKITAKVTEAPSAVNDAKDKLRLSKAQLQEQADKKAQEEDKIAKQKLLDDANARVKELEANTAKLKNILDLKNQAVAKTELAKAAAADPLVSPAPASAPQAKTAALPKMPIPKVVAASPLPVPEPQSGIMSQVMQYLPIGAGVLALLGLVGLWANQRKKKVDQFDDDTLMTGSNIKDNSVFGSTGGQSVDTNNSVFNSNFTPSASQLDANEVDPVAEADVYIAYGRDEQAEEILKEALRVQPDRNAVRLKLLEIYAHRKDARSFENVASELYGLTAGEGPDWLQAAALGLMIDPQNPLYAGGHDVSYPAVLGAPTLPIQSLDPESLLGHSLSLDMPELTNITTGFSPPPFTPQTGGRPVSDGSSTDGLDFDLGLTNTDEPEISNENPGPATPVQSSSSHADAFGDFNKAKAHQLGDPVQDAPVQDAEPTGDLPLEFTLDGLTPDTLSSAPELPEEAAEKLDQTVESLDFTDLDFDFDIPKSQASADVLDAGAELEHPAEENADSPAAKAVEYDLSNINFDFQKNTAAAGLDPTDSSPKPVSGDPEENIEFSAEMSTKLDLALAYQEIGDSEGARELLEEVLEGGNQEQIDRANTIMKELA